MPDDDKLPRSLSARWQRALKAFRAGESQEAIEHHVAKAAAETLRRTHGIPELPALGSQMYLDAATGCGAYKRRGHDREFNRNAMIWQVTRMRACLDSPEPWQRMVSEFPDLIDVTSLTQQEVVRLYRAYVQEWSSHEDIVRSYGAARRDSRTVA